MSLQPSGYDPEALARGPERLEANLIELANAEGLDLRQILTGHILATMRGDDVNIFFLQEGQYTLRIGAERRRMYEIRSKWEVESQWLPNELLAAVRTTRETLLTLDWTSQEGFENARDIWREKILEPAMAITDQDPGLDEAVTYYVIHQWSKPPSIEE